MGDLKDAFLAALDKFNNPVAGSYQQLRSLLHDEVVMNEVDAPYGIHNGGNNIIVYFNQRQAKRKPQFIVNPNTLSETPDRLPPGAHHGQVSGLDGQFQDNSVQFTDEDGTVQPPSEFINVRYIFNLRKEANGWLIINATAIRI